MKKYLYPTLLLVILSISLLMLTVWSTHFKSNTNEGTSYIFVYQNTDLTKLNEQLNETGRMINIRRFSKAAKYYNLEGNIKPGRYKITEGMNNRLLVRTFRLGWQSPHNLVLSGNIRSMDKLASIIAGKTESDSLEVLQTLTDFNLVDSLGLTKESFPAIFLLNTYEIYWTVKPKDLVLRFKKEFDRFWNENRVRKASELELNPLQVTTLASIVAEESNLSTEHPIIAGVYINRLKIGMPLQADPTIKFALNDPTIKRILYKHLEIDSPYNTYKIKGLPPGPITLPSPRIIDSVLEHNKHNYLYFCAKATLDGSHVFASNLTEHNRNARAYQRAISRLK